MTSDLSNLTELASIVEKTKYDSLAELQNALRKDFELFVSYVCKRNKFRVGRIQLLLARTLQNATSTKMIQCFRGASKSFIIDCYILWRWLRCIDTKVLILGAKEWNAKKHVRNLQTLVRSLSPVLDSFAVSKSIENGFQLANATIENDLSLYCTGIYSAIESSRADLIVLDDTEVKTNSATPSLREKLLKRFSEVQAILQPPCRHILKLFEDQDVPIEVLEQFPENVQGVYIGTPKSEYSVYNPDSVENHPLAEAERLIVPAFIDSKSSFPERFSTTQLLQKKKLMSSPEWYLEMMLDPTLLDKQSAVIKIDSVLQEKIDQKKLVDIIMTVDPVGDSGTGKDEGAISILANRKDKQIVHVLEIKGFKNISGEEFCKAVLAIAKAHGVKTVYVESNFNAYLSLFQRIVKDFDSFAGIIPIRATKNKHDRLIETLEPTINSGMISFEPGVLADKETLRQFKTLTFEHLPEPNDRLDSLSMGISVFEERGFFKQNSVFKIESATRDFNWQ